METLENLLNRLELMIINADKINTSVSSSPVRWHIEHSLLVINNVIDRLNKSDSKQYKPKFSLLKTLIYTTGTIPRGKVKAPKTVQPVEGTSVEQLRLNIQI